nr:crosslink repair DNA glycosylase YcaQ family protein [Sphingobium yanoikuyae]
MDGPLTAAAFEDGKSRSGWWDWSHTKHALEWLFWAALITTAPRRGSFARVYDLPERVIPQAIRDLPTPDAATAQRHLIDRSARAMGVATAADLRDYFQPNPNEGDHAIAALAEQCSLVPIKVEGWNQKAGCTATQSSSAAARELRCSHHSIC